MKKPIRFPKISAAKKGVKNPNAGAALKAKWADPEWRAALLARRTPLIQAAHAAGKGRASASEALKAKWREPEYRAKMKVALAQNGAKSWHYLTPEQAADRKARISAGVKAYWAKKRAGQVDQ